MWFTEQAKSGGKYKNFLGVSSIDGKKEKQKGEAIRAKGYQQPLLFSCLIQNRACFPILYHLTEKFHSNRYIFVLREI